MVGRSQSRRRAIANIGACYEYNSLHGIDLEVGHRQREHFPTLADFWAEALGYEVENSSAFIKQLMADGRIGADAVIEHRGRAIFRGYAAIRHPEDPFDKRQRRRARPAAAVPGRT